MRYVGVDLHKRNFVVCFLDESDCRARGGSLRFANTTFCSF
jgi:hypothetical protein